MLYGSILKTTRHIKGCRQAERRFDGNARDVPPDSCSSWDSKTKTALKGEDRLGRENVSHSGKGTDRKQQVMRSVVDPLLGCQRELNSWDVPSQNRTEKTHEKITMQIGFFFVFFFIKRVAFVAVQRETRLIVISEKLPLTKMALSRHTKMNSCPESSLPAHLSVCLSVIRISVEPFIWSTSLFTGLLLGTQWSACCAIWTCDKCNINTNWIALSWGIRRKQHGD